MILHRRSLIASSAALAFSGLARNVHAAEEETYLNEVVGYGPLKRDPNGVLDLPEGFSYRIVSQGGETMADGLLVPGQFDGMGCFALDDTRVALVRNHELKGSSASHRNWGPGGYNQERIGRLDANRAYDTYKDGRPLPGGTTTVADASGVSALSPSPGKSAPAAQRARGRPDAGAGVATRAALTIQAGETQVSMKTSNSQWPRSSGARLMKGSGSAWQLPKAPSPRPARRSTSGTTASSP